MSSLSDRLQKALALHNGQRTKSGLAAACGIKAPSVSGWFGGKSTSMMAEHIFPAAAYLGVRALWLATGLGPMLPDVAAREEAMPYDDWPIRSVSKREFLGLPPAVRAEIERYIELQLAASNAHRSTVRKSAA